MNVFNNSSIKWYCIPVLIIACASCSRLLIEPDPSNEPEKNFEVFWNDVYNTYPFFNYDKVDWKDTYARNRPRVSSNTTDEELFGIFQDMMTPLLDGHKSLLSTPNNLYWPKHPPERNYAFAPIVQYLSDAVTKRAADVTDKSRTIPVCTFGFIKNTDILYFYINTYLTEYRFDKLLDSINHVHNVSGLVLDVRNNGGGYLGSMWELMGMFTQAEVRYALNKEKVGPLDDNFGPYYYFALKPNTAYQLPSIKVVLLTSRYCFSATEHSVLISGLLPNVTSLGDTTGGALSPIIERTLPNGMSFTLVNSITVSNNYKLYEKIGIPPEIPVSTRANDFTSTKDPHLDKALELLK